MFNQRNSNNNNMGGDLSDALLSHANNHLMSDVVLVSTVDGDHIPASRFVLGARSSTLQKMLFEGNRSEVKIPYPGVVVRAMVEFCRSNTILEGTVSSLTRDPLSLRQVVHLCDCAKQYKLHKLEELTCDLVSAFLWSDGSRCNFCWACAVFDEAVGTNLEKGDTSLVLMRLVMDSIRSDPNIALLRGQEFQPPGVLFLSPHALELVIRDQRMNCEEIILFRSLQVWNNAKKQSSSRMRRSRGRSRSTARKRNEDIREEDDASVFTQGTNMDDDVSGFSQQLEDGGKSTNNKRWFGTKGSRNQKERNHPTAVKLATAIDLSRIAPSDLCGTVSKSGLVSEPDIWRALKETALRTERENEAPTSKIRIRENLQTIKEKEDSYIPAALIPNHQPQGGSNRERPTPPNSSVKFTPVKQPTSSFDFANFTKFSSPSPIRAEQQQTTPRSRTSKVTPQSRTPKGKVPQSVNLSPSSVWEGVDDSSIAGSVNKDVSFDQGSETRNFAKSRLIRLAERLDPHLSCLCG